MTSASYPTPCRLASPVHHIMKHITKKEVKTHTKLEIGAVARRETQGRTFFGPLQLAKSVVIVMKTTHGKGSSVLVTDKPAWISTIFFSHGEFVIWLMVPTSYQVCLESLESSDVSKLSFQKSFEPVGDICVVCIDG